MPFEIDLSNKTVIVTGASAGIGLGVAKMYARANANIVGCAIDDEGHPNVAALRKTIFAESGRNPLYVQADVTRTAEMEMVVARTIEHFDAIDILASNAGLNVFKGIDNCSKEDWLYNMNLNLESHLNIARLCKPFLQKSKDGVIIINSSCHAFNTNGGIFPYNIAKAGLKALVQSLTIEWGPTIRTVGVAPGYIESEPLKKYFDSTANPEKERAKVLNKFPLKRFGTPDEIGGWFVFLSSGYAAYAGGQTFLIDGGKSAVMVDE